MKTPFDGDANLVPGPVDIDDSLVPPPPFGTYGIRWPSQALANPVNLYRVKLLLWSCMDRRILRPLYDAALQRGYREDSILVMSMAGGPVQVGEDRVNSLRQMFAALARALPGLEKIWGVAHIGLCGGIKYFCGGQPLAEALKPQYRAQASARNADVELYATQLILPGAYRLLPESWQSHTELGTAEPNESTESVKLHSQWFTPSDAKLLTEIVETEPSN